jgi:hypothetical protein
MSKTARVETAAFVVGLIGLALLGHAAFEWLDSARWSHLSMLDVACALARKDATQVWCLAPTSWKGLHLLLSWLPIWVLCLLCSVWLLATNK